MVGMSTDMVLFAKGQPQSKSREMDGQMPFEEWIYGTPPEEVDFVRINGNRVIRVEVAKMGETPVIFTNDEVSGMMRTDGTPLETAANHTRITKRATCSATPTRKRRQRRPACAIPANSFPADDRNANASGGQKNVGVMRPVQFPKQRSSPALIPIACPTQEPAAPANGSPPASAKPASPPAKLRATEVDSLHVN
jgi:hypothetical protein